MLLPTALLLDIDKAFNKTDLEYIAEQFILPFFRAHEKLLVAKDVNRTIVKNINSKRFRKGLLVEMYATVFFDKEIFLVFEKTLHENTRIILKELTWNEKLVDSEIEKIHRISVKNSRGEMHPSMRLFSNSNDYEWRAYRYVYYLFLPFEVRKLLINNYEKPKYYDLIPLEKRGETQFVYEGEKLIFQELPRIAVYRAQDHIKLTKNGKPMAASVKRMVKMLKLKEFYPAKPYKELVATKANLLANLITRDKGFEKSIVDESLIRKLVAVYNQKFLSVSGILTHLKGSHHIEMRSQVNVEVVFLKLLKEFPTNKWVSVENIIDFLKYRMFNLNPVQKWDARQYLYVDKMEGHYGKTHINEAYYNKFITQPLIKGTFFLFASLGLLDIAYDIVDTKAIGDTYYSYYDNLKYVKLNNLGAFIANKTKVYEMPVGNGQDKMIFSEDALMITANEGNLTAEILLENYARKVGNNRYITDAATFMKGCSNKRQLQDKITLFKETIKKKLPKNWDNFFDSLLKKCDPLISPGEHKVYKLPDNQELIRLIARDTVLRKLVIKAEQFHIIVMKKNISSFKSRLREFGYLIE